MSRVICEVFRSPKKTETYLYVDKSTGLARVPEELLALFGDPQPVLTLLLHPQKTLARADIHKVLASLAEQGYYLQLPQQNEDYMQAVHRHNDKLWGAP